MLDKMKELLLLVTVILVPIGQAKEISKSAAQLPISYKFNNAITPYIIGGQETQPFAYPFMGSLQEDGEHKCGVSFIGENRVLTAAHCIDSAYYVFDTYIDSLQVKFEGHDLKEDSQWTTYQVTQIVTHDHYDWAYADAANADKSYDIAILELDRPVENIKPIKLADMQIRESLTSSDTLRTMGWGKIDDGTKAHKLREVDLQYVPNVLCKKFEYYDKSVTDLMMCAGAINTNESTCNGDSGGPLIVKRDNEWIQVGIVNFGIACGKNGHPTVFADIGTLSGWLFGKNLEFGFKNKTHNAFVTRNSPTLITGEFKNTLEFPITISQIAISQEPIHFYFDPNPYGIELKQQNCEGLTLAPKQECQFTVLVPEEYELGHYKLDANITAPIITAYSQTLNFYKTDEITENVNQHLSTPSSTKWYSGGNTKWALTKTDKGEHVLISSDKTDVQSKNSSQLGYLTIEIDDIHISALSFDYLNTGDTAVDYLEVYHNGKLLRRDRGQQEVGKNVHLELNKGQNQITVLFYNSSVELASNVILYNVKTIFTNQAPIASVKLNNIEVRSELDFTLDASPSQDADEDALTYQWVDIHNSEQVISEESIILLKAPKVTTNTLKTYLVTVKDEFDATSSAQVNVNVTANNAPNVALSSDKHTVNVGEEVLITSVFSDPDNDSLTLTWTQTSGTQVDLPEEAEQIKFTAPSVTQNERLTFTLSATDQFELSSAASIDILVNAPLDTEASRPAPSTPQNEATNSGSFWLLHFFALLMLAALRHSRN
ncbi:trypsin-like serine protease [Pseudoalteromonas luteoviolacea]|uniref:serine protease n=1 Tax=Pseudoalteromonas luteoviolacea TaxID=43657 RepID=UPI001B3A3A20|nr:serine protease [Pseudoalteromonas luteoviolacea]MBQ4877759.1 trypsin-like serine protease [Pseudoalteromonas luteoviolacea]MBQ4906795.1 trypsin-like serine protease [Pseudoalteromonas luteoviolacea]